MEASVFAAYPGTDHELRAHAHEPSVGVIVGGTGLAAKLGVSARTDEAVETCRCSAWLGETALQKLLHQEGALIRYHLFLGRWSLVYHLAVVVYNFCNQYRVVVLAVVGDGAVGASHLQEVDIARTQSQRRLVVQRTLNSHLLGGLDDALDAHLLTQSHSHGVDTLGEGTLQRNAVAREGAVGVARCPGYHFVLDFVVYLHRDIFVSALVARGQSLVHRLGVYEELEGRARLSFCGHLVVLPVVEVDVAHPSLYGSRLWLHRHEGAVHEGGHILDTVLRGHHLLNRSLVVVEHLHRVNPLAVVVVHRVGVVRIFRQEVLVERLSLGDAVDEVGYDIVVLVLPRILAHPVALAHLVAMDAPVVVEAFLHLFHLLAGSLLGIFLHAGVDGGVNLQSAGVEVVALVLAPVFQVVGDGLAEVLRLSVVVFLHLEVEHDRLLLQFLEAVLTEVAVGHHVIEHGVAACQTVLWVGARVVVGCSLEHAHEHGNLVGGEFLRRGVEVSLGGSLDAVGVASEVHGVGIHGDDFLLRVDRLQLHGDDPLLALHDEDAEQRNFAQQSRGVLRAHTEHVLRQLLCDGGGATCVVMQEGVLCRTKHADRVDADVLVESLVLGIHECLEEVGVHLLVFHRSTVLVEVLADELSVGAIDFGSLGCLWVEDAGEVARRLTEEPEEVDVYCAQIQEEGDDAACQGHEGLGVPSPAYVQLFVPWPEGSKLMP